MAGTQGIERIPPPRLKTCFKQLTIELIAIVKVNFSFATQSIQTIKQGALGILKLLVFI